ncbi:hypothetical protein MTR67_013606 [Solanum verrucosum]|uniref:Secreted protein n=1 Tax=Solanum verrucosum TaxID=315347 RepID=A0AAF0QBI6_SOLVR|nr:hypothetical protein MTR67_013606 [Solanum verrucosum]
MFLQFVLAFSTYLHVLGTQWHSRTPSMDRRWTHGQVTDRSSCSWINAPKAQLQSRLTVDQHGPSIDPRSVGLTVCED